MSHDEGGSNVVVVAVEPVPWAWIKAARDIVKAEPRRQPSSMPVRLLPWLFLSDMPSVLKSGRLEDLGITAVLTANKVFRDDDLWAMTANLADRDILLHGYAGGVDIIGYEMMRYHWNDAKGFIQSALKEPNTKGVSPKIVVHCAAGTNRSALIAGAAMLEFGADREMTFLDVIRILKTERGVVLNNVWFIRQLAEFAQEKQRLGPRPVGYSDDPVPKSQLVF